MGFEYGMTAKKKPSGSFSPSYVRLRTGRRGKKAGTAPLESLEPITMGIKLPGTVQ